WPRPMADCPIHQRPLDLLRVVGPRPERVQRDVYVRIPPRNLRSSLKDPATRRLGAVAAMLAVGFGLAGPRDGRDSPDQGGLAPAHVPQQVVELVDGGLKCRQAALIRHLRL